MINKKYIVELTEAEDRAMNYIANTVQEWIDNVVKNRARQAIEIGACEYINIKPGRVGGITNSLKINEISEQAGIPVWIGGMLESALGVAICIELATLDNFTYPGDLFPSSRFYSNDLFEPYNEFKSPYLFDPIINLPTPNEKLLKKFTVKESHIT